MWAVESMLMTMEGGHPNSDEELQSLNVMLCVETSVSKLLDF
jgi:hypothetical protein